MNFHLITLSESKLYHDCITDKLNFENDSHYYLEIIHLIFLIEDPKDIYKPHFY